MKSEVFNGRASEMRDSPWMASEDLDRRPNGVVLTIDKVKKHKGVQFEGGRSKEEVYSLAFKGAKRELVLNGTNRRVMRNLYGQEVKDWIGKQVHLYVDRNVKMMGEITSGLRIKAPTDVAQKQAQEKSQAKTDSALKSVKK